MGATKLRASMITTLRLAGYSTKDLKKALFTAAEMRVAKLPAAELKWAGFTAGEMNKAGYFASELLLAGWTLHDLRCGGYTAADLTFLTWSRITSEQLLAVGYTEAQLRGAGFLIERDPHG